MKRIMSVLLALAFVFSIFASAAGPALTVEIESGSEFPENANANEPDASLMAKSTLPGLNMITGTSNAYTLEENSGEDALSSVLVKGSGVSSFNAANNPFPSDGVNNSAKSALLTKYVDLIGVLPNLR